MATVRLTVDEMADLDERRGALSRSEFLRWLVLRARREGIAFEK